jgi:hypothetical protein
MDNKIVIEFDEEEIELLSSAVSMFLTMTNIEVSRHKMYKDESMDRLFAKMEAYANAGVLWTRIMKAQGISQETISEYLERVDKR